MSPTSWCPQGIDTYGYDPEKAKQLLAEAGWDKINGDKPITILTYYTSPLATNVLAAMQAMLAQVGINIVPRAVDTPTYNSIVYQQSGNAGEFPLIYAGLQNGPDASNINIGLNEKQIPPAGANLMRIRMPEVTDALDAALGRGRRHQARRPLPGRLQGDQRQPALGHDVGGQAATASPPPSCKDFVWTPLRPAALTRPTRKVVDRRIGQLPSRGRPSRWSSPLLRESGHLPRKGLNPYASLQSPSPAASASSCCWR